MRSIFYLLMATAFFSCSEPQKEPSTPEEKAQMMISDTIKANLPHPDSYQAISFSTLDSTFADPDLDSADIYLSMAEHYDGLAMQVLPSDYKKSSAYSDSSMMYSKKVNEYLANHKKTFDGFVMVHTYQASSASSLMTKKTIKVYFDPSLRIVGIQ